jgi:hypothetical protein
LSNLILKKTTTAIFLTIVLIGGTFAAISPSFITGVNAEPYYGMDKDRKSDKKDVSVQSLKCNNINVNINGLELNVLPSFLGGEVAAEASESQTDANSFANNNGGSNSGSQINDFRFICINNNNNTVIEEQPPLVEECAAAADMEACFEEFLVEGQFPAFVEALEGGITVEINGQEFTLTSFDDICFALETLEGLTIFEVREALNNIIVAAGIPFPDNFSGLAECIAATIGIFLG